MARKNVVELSTNVSPEQFEAVANLAKKFSVDRSHLVRMALSQFVEQNGGEWPIAEIKRGARSLSIVDKATTN